LSKSSYRFLSSENNKIFGIFIYFGTAIFSTDLSLFGFNIDLIIELTWRFINSSLGLSIELNSLNPGTFLIESEDKVYGFNSTMSKLHLGTK